MRGHLTRLRSATVAGAALAAVGATVGHAEVLPAAGRYRVEVTLEMPNVRGSYLLRTVERCLAPGAAEGAFLAIVSSPQIAACPLVRRRHREGRLEVEVACEPVNTGRASASFELGATGYTGRIAVTMGGKNMTLMEIQRAERIGDCP
jgi:hypothetical protein